MLREFATLAGTLTLGAVTADAASAATVYARPTIQGAGRVWTSATSTRPSLSCEQAPPVSNSASFLCPEPSWTVSNPLGPATMTLTAGPAAGSGYMGWRNCPSSTGLTCTLTAATTLFAAPVAQFQDSVPPPPVFNLTISPSGSAVPNVIVRWFASESGQHWTCSVDSGPHANCVPGMGLELAEGAHSVSVRPIDAAGNTGPHATASYTVVDNADPTPARHIWTVTAPAPAATPTPAPQAGASEPSVAASAPVAASEPVSFTLRHSYSKGRLTRLEAVGLPAGAKLVVTVKCPRKQGCPKSPTTLRKLVGKRLAPGTRITVAAGATKRSITLKRDKAA